MTDEWPYVEYAVHDFDTITAARHAGIWVPAYRCPSCGRYAHVEMGNDSSLASYWMVTNCGKCGRWEVRGGPVERRAYAATHTDQPHITVRKLEET